MRKVKEMIELEDEDLNPGFAQLQMVIQLGKILDSEGNPVELDTVITDDNYMYTLNMESAKKLHSAIKSLISVEATSTRVNSRDYPSIDAARTKIRRNITDKIQFSDGFDKLIYAVLDIDV